MGEIIFKFFEVVAKIFKERKGVILEFQDPNWFEFRTGFYSNFVPSKIYIWVKTYITNTTQSVPAYFLFIFKINHEDPKRFVEELKIIPNEFLIRFYYKMKGHKIKTTTRKFNFKAEYKKFYENFLNSFYYGQNIDLNEPNEIKRRELLEKLKDI